MSDIILNENLVIGETLFWILLTLLAILFICILKIISDGNYNESKTEDCNFTGRHNSMDGYICGRCKKEVLLEDKFCKNCGEILEWEGNEQEEHKYVKDLEIKSDNNTLTAFLWMTGISLLLFWLPLFGQFIAGFIGGRKANSLSNAIIASLIPVFIFAFFFTTIFSWLMSLFGLSFFIPLIATSGIIIGILFSIGLISGAILGNLQKQGKL